MCREIERVSVEIEKVCREKERLYVLRDRECVCIER